MSEVKEAFNKWKDQLKKLELDVAAGNGGKRGEILAEEARLYHEFERALCESLATATSNDSTAPASAGQLSAGA